ncbi:hypothetical protein AB4306_04485 [Vibrio splendidus]
MPGTEEIQISQEQVRKNKAKVLAKINQQGIMSQGFRLVNVQDYNQRLQALRQKVENFDYLNAANKQQDQVILDIMTEKEKIHDYLDQTSSQKLASGNLDFGSRNQVANATLKKKQLFMMFMETVEAQEALKEYAVKVASVCNGTVKQPPGAYLGVKDFHTVR